MNDLRRINQRALRRSQTIWHSLIKKPLVCFRWGWIFKISRRGEGFKTGCTNTEKKVFFRIFADRGSAVRLTLLDSEFATAAPMKAAKKMDLKIIFRSCLASTGTLPSPNIEKYRRYEKLWSGTVTESLMDGTLSDFSFPSIDVYCALRIIQWLRNIAVS